MLSPFGYSPISFQEHFIFFCADFMRSISRSNALESVSVSSIMSWLLTTCWISHMLSLLLIPWTFRRRALRLRLKFELNLEGPDCYSLNTHFILVGSHSSLVPSSHKMLIASFSCPHLNISRHS